MLKWQKQPLSEQSMQDIGGKNLLDQPQENMAKNNISCTKSGRNNYY